MNNQILDLIINIPVFLFLDIDWDDDSFNKLKENILYAESNINDELSSSLFGRSFIEKEDIIREYIVNIGHMYDQILNCSFEYDKEYPIPNPIAINLVKDFYQTIIDLIGIVSINNSINLRKIIDSNYLTAGMLDISMYDNQVKSSTLEKGKLKNKLQSSFPNEDAFELFEYLIKNESKQCVLITNTIHINTL